MKKKSKIGLFSLFSILGLIGAAVIFMFYRYYSNAALGEELRKEADAWLASLPRIPESENGAPIILKGVELLKDLPEQFEDDYARIGSETDAKTFREYLADNKEALGMIEKGLSYKNWAYTTDLDIRSELIRPKSAFLKGPKVYYLKGSLAVFERKTSDALKEYINLLRLAGTLSRERVLVSRMIATVPSLMGLEQLLEMDSRSTLSREDVSSALDTLLELHQRQSNVFLMFEADYYRSLMYLAEFADDTWPGVVYDFRRDYDILKKWLEIHRKAATDEHTNFPKKLQDYKMCAKELRSQATGLAWLWVLDHSSGIKVFARHETLFRGTIAVVAIRLYEAKNGTLPGSLDELCGLVPKEILIDPFSGKNLIYRREGDDFYLYSAGYNGVDDECKDSKPIFQEGATPDMPDIIFHTPSPGK